MGHIGVSMTKEQIIELLSRSEVFCREENKTINRIAEESTVVFSRGQIVSDYKEYFGKIGVILSGTIVAEEKNSCCKVVLNTLKEGSIIGVTSLFNKESECVSRVVSKTKSEILFIAEERMTDYLLSDKDLNISYITFLTEKIRFLNRKITTFTTPTTESALVKYLSNQKEDELIIVAAKLSKQLNIGRSSLYRAIDELQKKKIIEYKNGVLKILNKGKLCIQ
jgi:CRP-like cAMP-binding protein